MTPCPPPGSDKFRAPEEEAPSSRSNAKSETFKVAIQQDKAGESEKNEGAIDGTKRRTVSDAKNDANAYSPQFSTNEMPDRSARASSESTAPR